MTCIFYNINYSTLKNVHHINGIFPVRDVNHKYHEPH